MSLDDAYANAPYIPSAAEYPPRWQAEAAAYRAALGQRARLRLPYGAGSRQKFDLFLPEGAPRGLILFIHGGFWRAFGREDWSHLAAGGVDSGWAVAVPSYTLAPKVRISRITEEIIAAIASAADAVEGPIVLTGHSAGGHLAARMACSDVSLPAVERLLRVVPISPLSDLRPLLRTRMNEDLRLDEPEAEAESPVLREPRREVRCHVWVGAEERPAFIDQAHWLGEAWGAPVTEEPGRHHFDVIEGLADRRSPLMQAVLGGL